MTKALYNVHNITPMVTSYKTSRSNHQAPYTIRIARSLSQHECICLTGNNLVYHSSSSFYFTSLVHCMFFACAPTCLYKVPPSTKPFWCFKCNKEASLWAIKEHYLKNYNSPFTYTNSPNWVHFNMTSSPKYRDWHSNSICHLVLISNQQLHKVLWRLTLWLNKRKSILSHIMSCQQMIA